MTRGDVSLNRSKQCHGGDMGEIAEIRRQGDTATRRHDEWLVSRRDQGIVALCPCRLVAPSPCPLAHRQKSAPPTRAQMRKTMPPRRSGRDFVRFLRLEELINGARS